MIGQKGSVLFTEIIAVAMAAIRANALRSFLTTLAAERATDDDIRRLRLLLDDPTGGVRDPQVHYDGRRILFNASYKFGNRKIKTRKSNSAMQEELQRISE